MDTVIEQINCINWHDFRLDAISINYEDAVIYFSSENEQQYNIQCKNFIGIQYYGQWDECIIRNISIKTSRVFIDENRKVVKQNNPVNLCGGGVRKCDGVWYDVCVCLIDGVTIDIICTEVSQRIGGWKGDFYMSKYSFLQKYVVASGTVVKCSDSKYCFYEVNDQEIIDAENELGQEFPQELIEFYKDIGYGYIGQDNTFFLNLIMHPNEIVKLRKGLDFYGNMEADDFSYYSSKIVFPFFNLGGESDFIVISLTGETKGEILYFEEPIANNFEDFIKKMHQKTDYFI